MYELCKDMARREYILTELKKLKCDLLGSGQGGGVKIKVKLQAYRCSWRTLHSF